MDLCDGLDRVPQVVTAGPQKRPYLEVGWLQMSGVAEGLCVCGGGCTGQTLWAPHPLLRAHVSTRNAAAVRLSQRR